MVDIPYDIWCHITSYLTTEEVWGLRYLSRALLDIAMDSRYGTVEVSMNFHEHKTYIHNFLRFRDPDIAKRIRNLSYHPNALTTFPARRSKKILALSSIQRRFRSLFAKRPVTGSDMVEVLEGFTNLVSLEVRCVVFDPVNAFPESVPLIHANFKTCYSQLQNLVFYVHLAQLPVIIFPNLMLPSLSSLSLTFFGSTAYTSFEPIVTTTIVPFINRHSNTLTSLVFKMMAGENIDIAVLLEKLANIPSLKTIFICISSSTFSRPLAVAPPQTIARFLTMHRTTLQTINLGLMDRPYQLIDSIFKDVTGEFPNLEEFSVLCWGFHRTPSVELNLGPTLDFIKRCSSSLVSFDIMGGAQTTDKVYQLLNPRERLDNHFMKLRSLHMAIPVLTPEVMDLFASQLPNLHSLELYVTTLKSRDNLPGAVVDHYEFCVKMGLRNYSSWKLEHLVLFLQYTDPLTWSTNNTGPIVFAKAIPSLKTFNGRSIADYPRTGLAVALFS